MHPKHENTYHFLIDGNNIILSTCDAICINEASSSDQRNITLLGVVFNSHLKFSSHVDAAIVTWLPFNRPPQKAGAKESSLEMFYQKQVISILCYPAPSWYSLISGNDKEKLEQFQQICLRVISPHQEEYESRLASCSAGLWTKCPSTVMLSSLSPKTERQRRPSSLSDYILNLRDDPESPLQQNHQQGKNTNSTGGQKAV